MLYLAAIAGEDGDDCADAQFAFTTPSDRFLLPVEFSVSPSACPSPRGAAMRSVPVELAQLIQLFVEAADISHDRR